MGCTSCGQKYRPPVVNRPTATAPNNSPQGKVPPVVNPQAVPRVNMEPVRTGGYPITNVNKPEPAPIGGEIVPPKED
jgi:hypothetical protein